MNEQPSKSTAPFQVVLMFLIILATLFLGFYMMPGSQEERDQLLKELGTTNHGTLLIPTKSILDLSLTDAENNPWQWTDHKPKWRLLIQTGATCEGDCGKLLYTTRQVHIRLGNKTHRVERMLLATEGKLNTEFASFLENEHPYLKVLYSDVGQFTQWLSDTNSPWQRGEGKVVLVDRSGVAMMTYDTNHEGNDILEDINHLLKYSAE